MLKYLDSAVVFQEFPDEIALAVDITQCPCTCEGCSESYLREDIGEFLTNDAIDELIKKHRGVSLFGLMGGDNDHEDCIRVADYIHAKYPSLKVGMYSGFDSLDLELAKHLDYYKVGRFIMVDSLQEYGGPINFPNSNQIMYKNVNGNLLNITQKFRKDVPNDISKYIIK